MAAAAGTALFRSMASKITPHRVIAARGLHSSGVGRTSPNPSRLSTGSSATSNENLAARNQQVHRQVGDHLADSGFNIKREFMAATNTCLAVLVFGSGLYYNFVKPELNKLKDRTAALYGEVFELRQEISKLKDETMETSVTKKSSTA